MRIAIDMDEVIADTHGARLALYRDRFGYDWSDDQMAGRHLSELADPLHAAEVAAEMHKGFFFAHLAVIAGAQDALARLAGAGHEIWIATAAMDYPASGPHKITWLATHFPSIPLSRVVFCGDKGIVRADVLIDDHPRHFDGFAGQGVCFTAPHNIGVDVERRLDRWVGVEAVLEAVA